MSFRELIETSQAVALADKLYPSDLANWHFFCREYSKKFFTPLTDVMNLDPEFVITQFYSELYSELDPEEHQESIQDIVSSLKDPEYDVKKERAYREELRKMVEEEKERLERGDAVHTSLEKNKTKKEPEQEGPKNIPKSGGLNMNLIRQLQNEDQGPSDF